MSTNPSEPSSIPVVLHQAKGPCLRDEFCGNRKKDDGQVFLRQYRPDIPIAHEQRKRIEVPQLWTWSLEPTRSYIEEEVGVPPCRAHIRNRERPCSLQGNAQCPDVQCALKSCCHVKVKTSSGNIKGALLGIKCVRQINTSDVCVGRKVKANENRLNLQLDMWAHSPRSQETSAPP